MTLIYMMTLKSVLAQRIPSDEYEETMHFFHTLSMLDSHIDNFSNDIALFDFAVSRPAVQWAFIAARDGAMQIFHFAAVLTALRKHLSQCPTLNSWIDRKELGRILGVFKGHFRDNEKIRHAIAHQAQNGMEPNIPPITQGASNPLMSFVAGSKFRVVDCLIDRQYLCASEGKLLSYEIDQATLDKLNEIKNRVLNTFNPVLQHAQSLPPGQMLEPKK